MYNENLTDRTQCIIFQNLVNAKLSEGSITAIRRLFPVWCDLYKYIQENVNVSCIERWELMDQIYPEQID